MNKTRYLDLLNLSQDEEVYKKIQNLASDLSDKEHLIRSCIFDLHTAVEIELKRIFYHTFYNHLFLTDDEIQNKKTVSDFDKVIDKLSFMDMWRILKPIMTKWYPDFESIGHLNTTRSQAAHRDVKRVFYKNRSPFSCPDCLAEMYFDVWAIKQHIPKYFWNVIEKPKQQLKQYIENDIKKLED